MINVIIIDDEAHCITALQDDLSVFCTDVTVLETCDSAKKGIEAILRHKPDLIFLDIHMPQMDGFEMLRQLEDVRNFDVVFTTAFDHFAIQALKANAQDYLLKPIDPTELALAVKRIEKRKTDNGNQSQLLQNLLQQNTSKATARLALPCKNGYEFVLPEEILYCKADGSYTEIVFTDGHKLLVSKYLGEIEGLLPEATFARIHYSSLVNVAHVKHLKRDTNYYVLMSNGEKLDVARSKKNVLFEKMGIS